jgi:hypothetical protein
VPSTCARCPDRAGLWDSLDDDTDEAAFRAAMAGLVAELPADDPVGHFEMASAYDSTGGELGDAVAAVLALSLTDAGREREAVVLLLHALSDHLPRYQRSMHRYADALLAD